MEQNERRIEPTGTVMIIPSRCQICGHPHQPIGHQIKLRWVYGKHGSDRICDDCYDRTANFLIKKLADVLAKETKAGKLK